MSKRIREARPTDMADIMKVMEAAKKIMRQSGNMHQWGEGYPSEAVIMVDMERNGGYVVEDAGRIVGYFAFLPSPDPTYSMIYDGVWLDDVQPYHVVHRIASYPDAHGIFSSIMDFCFSKDSNIRIDTHKDNLIMQHNIEKHGFTYCGIIYLTNGDERLAYQKLKDKPVFHQKTFQKLTVNELYELLRIRSEVFVVEQDCIYQDMDGDDQKSIHLWLTVANKVVALARVCPAGTHMQEVSIGRVIATERGKGYGRQMMLHAIEAAKKHFDAKQIDIEAQEYAKGFYESVGFKQSSETFMLDGIPHIRMTLKIEEFDDRYGDIYAMDAEIKKVNGMDLM
jgi:predicted GNAT family N-acyltransferase